MDTGAVALAPELSGVQWLRRQLAPHPGRWEMTVRITVTVMLVVIISNALQVPEILLSAYMVLFATKENKVVTTIAGIMVILGVTLAIAASLLIYTVTCDRPEIRVPFIAVVLFGGFYFARVSALGPLAFGIAFVLAATQSIAELMPSAEYLAHTLLWLWIAISYPIALTILVNLIPLSRRPAATTPHAPRPHKQLLAADAFTNPEYVHYAFKVMLAAMTCYIIYTALDWPGIHTAFITCCFISLESLGATLHKGALRLVGCCIGGLLGFLSIMYLVPHMESIVSLTLLTGAVTALAGWVAAGSEDIAYGGLQIGLAFYMCLLQSFEPNTDFEKIRDRLVGIILGIIVTTIVFRLLWPAHEKKEASQS